MSGFLKFVGFGAAVYVGLMAVLYFMQRSMIYFPDPTRPEPAAFGVPEMTAVTLRTEDGLSLLAWWAPPRDAKAPVMAYFHGNAGHLGHRASKIRPYLDRGYGVLATAWRGYSGNPGSPSEEGLYADGRAALDFLDRQEIGRERRVLYGESLGSGVAVELAAKGLAAVLVLEAPFTAIADVAGARFPIFPVRWLVRDRFNSLAKIERVSVPLLIVHGERDRVIPTQLGRDLLAAANRPKDGVFIPQAGHNDLYEFGAAGHVVRFVEQNLKM